MPSKPTHIPTVTTTGEAIIRALLVLTRDHPRELDTLAATSVLHGIPLVPEGQSAPLERYALADLDWPMNETLDLIGACIDGGLVARADEPTGGLVPTDAGSRTLQALEAAPGAWI